MARAPGAEKRAIPAGTRCGAGPSIRPHPGTVTGAKYTRTVSSVHVPDDDAPVVASGGAQRAIARDRCGLHLTDPPVERPQFGTRSRVPEAHDGVHTRRQEVAGRGEPDGPHE